MTDYDKIAQALEYIQTHRSEKPSLDDIAKHVHLSPFHFQRLFTRWAGVSPKKFLQYLSVQRAKELLQQKPISLLKVTHQTGLSGTSRLHDLFIKLEGMTPGEYKNGGQDLEISYSLQASPFGKYLVASTARGICNVLSYDKSALLVETELKKLWPMHTLFREKPKAINSFRSFFIRR